MPSVHFMPADLTVDVPAGTLIHEAAIRAGLLDLELPCGGQGTCGQCLVEVGERTVMACQTKVSRDLEVRVPQTQDVAMRVVGDSHFLISDDLLPEKGRLSPLSRVARLIVPPASVEVHYSDWNRLVRELGSEISMRELGGFSRSDRLLPATTDISVLRNLAAALREQEGKVSVTLQERGAGLHVLDIQPGHDVKPALGAAIDIGTTTVAVQLVDLDDGRVLATRTSYNLQLRRGTDVITRIDYARTPERLAELRGLVLDTINDLIRQMTGNECVEADLRPASARVKDARPHGPIPDDIRAAFIAGNTTMIHLLLALPPRHIRETPYVPTVNPVPILPAKDVGLAIHPDAVVECAPGVGSYVGGDITAGLLATDLPTNHDEVFLFLDVGTNGEIVIGNADWMVACACSAGPAFEGSGIKCGMRAAEGAIEHIEITPRDAASYVSTTAGEKVQYRVIGGGKPAGICGSGLICLLGELFRSGIVDQAGRFHDGSHSFLIESGANTVSGEDLVITDSDLENLIRTKAAIYAACALILDNVGLDWSAISRVYIAGGFGRYIQITDAVLIGMLPDLPHQRFSYIGNAALTGAYIALLSRDHRQRLAEIAGRMTYVDLSSDPRYMDSYVKALFLPHTDPERFPSLAKILQIQRRNA